MKSCRSRINNTTTRNSRKDKTSSLGFRRKNGGWGKCLRGCKKKPVRRWVAYETLLVKLLLGEPMGLLDIFCGKNAIPAFEAEVLSGNPEGCDKVIEAVILYRISAYFLCNPGFEVL